MFPNINLIAGEETKNPKRSIPLSVVISLTVIFLSYFLLSTVLTMMLPYYDQNENAPLVYVFRHYNWKIAEYVVSFGAIFGLCASLMGSMFPLPRVVYAMANDGLIFEFLARINSRFKTPIYGTIIAGVMTGVLSALFNLSQLVNMMSIGTLMAYSMVAACVMLLRFDYVENSQTVDSAELLASKSGVWAMLFNIKQLKTSSKKTAGLATIGVTLYCEFLYILFTTLKLTSN